MCTLKSQKGVAPLASRAASPFIPWWGTGVLYCNCSLQQHRRHETVNELKQLSWNFETSSGKNQGILFSWNAGNPAMLFHWDTGRPGTVFFLASVRMDYAVESFMAAKTLETSVFNFEVKWKNR